jgi:hypothetical protein
MKVRRSVLGIVGAVMLVLGATTAMAASGSGGGGGGGGIPGDTFSTKIAYTADTCPIPAVVRDDYLDIYYCGLGKFLSKPGDFVLLVAGHTTLAAGTVREIRATSTLTLPCGIVATMSRFVETVQPVISPPGTPNALGVQSGKIADACPR